MRQAEGAKLTRPLPHPPSPPKPCTIVHYRKPPFRNALQQKGIRGTSGCAVSVKSAREEGKMRVKGSKKWQKEAFFG